MDNQSLSHSRYNCTYHIVFIPNELVYFNIGGNVTCPWEAIQTISKAGG